MTSLAWVYVILPYLSDSTLGLGDRLVEFTFTVEALALLAMVLGLAIGPGRKNVSFYLLTLCMIANVASEFAIGFELGSHSSSAAIAIIPTALGGLAMIAAGGAGLHPSITQLTERATDPVAQMNWQRVALMSVAGAIPPTIFVVDPPTRGFESAVISLCWLVITTLVVVRLAGVARGWEHARNIERILSRAAAASPAPPRHSHMADAAFLAAQQLADGNASPRSATWRIDNNVWLDRTLRRMARRADRHDGRSRLTDLARGARRGTLDGSHPFRTARLRGRRSVVDRGTDDSRGVPSSASSLPSPPIPSARCSPMHWPTLRTTSRRRSIPPCSPSRCTAPASNAASGH